jgi:hypothetical protein
MVTINFESEAFKRATIRARARKMTVRVTEFRKYRVESDSGKVYHVSFNVIAGKKVGFCDCQAGQNETLCVHLVSALPIHVYAARNRVGEAIATRQ